MPPISLLISTQAGCAVAVQPSAKGRFPEDHPQFIGTYWGSVSSEFTCETVESCDLYLCIGCVCKDGVSVASAHNGCAQTSSANLLLSAPLGPTGLRVG